MNNDDKWMLENLFPIEYILVLNIDIQGLMKDYEYKLSFCDYSHTGLRLLFESPEQVYVFRRRDIKSIREAK